MKIVNLTNNSTQILRQVRPDKPIIPARKQPFQSDSRTINPSPEKIQPAELLSENELNRLKQLFPDDGRKPDSGNMYLINRTKAAGSQVGKIVDLTG